MSPHILFRVGCRAVLASFCIAAAGCSSPAGLSDSIEGSFIRAAPTWDLNHDGNITCDEWRTYASSLFKEADKDHNGKLTAEEFSRLAKIDRLFEIADFKYYDVGHKGYVTEADIVEKPNPAFAELDKKGTCVISVYQLRAATTEQPKKENPAIPGSR